MRREEKTINEVTSSIADIVNKLESIDDRLEWVFRRQDDWDNGVQLQIQDAARMLGMSLATLVNWYEPEEEEEKE
jgi:hypothetical protein